LTEKAILSINTPPCQEGLWPTLFPDGGGEERFFEELNTCDNRKQKFSSIAVLIAALSFVVSKFNAGTRIDWVRFRIGL